MNIGAIPDEIKSLRCVLNHPSPIHHPHNRNPPPIYPHRRFLAIFREVLNKMSQKKHIFSQHSHVDQKFGE